MGIPEFEHFESKLNGLMKTCLEMDELGVKLHDLTPGSRPYELVLRQLEANGRFLKAQAGAIEELIAGITGPKPAEA